MNIDRTLDNVYKLAEALIFVGAFMFVLAGGAGEFVLRAGVSAAFAVFAIRGVITIARVLVSGVRQEILN